MPCMSLSVNHSVQCFVSFSFVLDDIVFVFFCNIRFIFLIFYLKINFIGALIYLFHFIFITFNITIFVEIRGHFRHARNNFLFNVGKCFDINLKNASIFHSRSRTEDLSLPFKALSSELFSVL